MNYVLKVVKERTKSTLYKYTKSILIILFMSNGKSMFNDPFYSKVVTKRDNDPRSWFRVLC